MLDCLAAKAKQQGLDLTVSVCAGGDSPGKSSATSLNDFEKIDVQHDMNDSTKRRESGDEDASKSAKRLLSSTMSESKGLGSDSNPLSMAYNVPMAPSPFIPNLGSSDEPPLFPEGINDLSQWGDTLIVFGKFKNRGMSYHDLVTSDDPEMVGYVKWCMSHGESADGHLKDLVQFMTFYGVVNGNRKAPCIPGTKTKRIFKQ